MCALKTLKRAKAFQIVAVAVRLAVAVTKIKLKKEMTKIAYKFSKMIKYGYFCLYCIRKSYNFI